MSSATNRYQQVVMRKLVKALYIEKNIDEKGAAKVLEDSTNFESIPNITCSFNVAPNAFVGLELTETTSYDIIFIQKDMPHLDASTFLKILRNTGAPMKVVLIVDADDSFTEEQAKALGFFTILKKPYQSFKLCEIIKVAVQRHEQSLGLNMGDSTV